MDKKDLNDSHVTRKARGSQWSLGAYFTCARSGVSGVRSQLLLMVETKQVSRHEATPSEGLVPNGGSRLVARAVD